MKSKKGFTLVELLVTIVLLGVVATVIIFNVTNVSKNSKKTEYERFIASIKSSASLYADMNPEAFQDLYINKSFIYITVGDLINSGLVDEKIKNPYTGENAGKDELIKVSLDTTSEALTFEYPIDKKNDTKQEVFMSAINDYIVWGEPYNCMQGIGSYKLALSDEEGNLITDVNKLQNDYHLACSMPTDFTKESDGRFSTTTSGTYDITYTWITESGIKKSYIRKLKVNPKVKPTFKTYFKGEEIYTDFEDLTKGKDIITPEYNSAENKWYYLTYKPYVEGADAETVKFNLKAQAINPEVKSPIYVVGGENNLVQLDDTTTYDAYDGEVQYTLYTIVSGHYDKNYTYDAEGKANMRQELVLPEDYIYELDGTNAHVLNADNQLWTTDKTFRIQDKIGANNTPIYSKFGIKSFEYRLVEDTQEPSKEDSIVDNYMFGKITDNESNRNVDIRLPMDACGKNMRRTYIYFRAINNNGYVGKWTKIYGYLTNQVDLLLLTNSKIGGTNNSTCTDCNSCCKTSGDENCYYCNQKTFIKIKNHTFVILERNKDGYIKAALNEVSRKCVAGSVRQHKTWGIQTCDGYFTGTYEQVTATQSVIIGQSEEILKDIPAEYLKDFKVEGTSVNIGAPTLSDYEKYRQALSTINASVGVWTLTKYTTTGYSTVSNPYNHGNSTSYTNSYYYVKKGAQTNNSYYGACNHVIPIIYLKPIYSCSGNGSKENPYIIL